MIDHQLKQRAHTPQRDKAERHGDVTVTSARCASMLDHQLEQRVRAMAERWQYTTEELFFALCDAHAEPERTARMAEDDERRIGEFTRAGLLPIQRVLPNNDATTGNSNPGRTVTSRPQGLAINQNIRNHHAS